RDEFVFLVGQHRSPSSPKASRHGIRAFVAEYTAGRPEPPFPLDRGGESRHCPAMAIPPDLAVSLARIRTRDGFWLDGLMAMPVRGRRVAVVWVHGLGSTFSAGQPASLELSARLNAAGLGYFKFNTRGHDVVARRGPRLAGAAFERFGDCVHDIRAMIAFASQRGFPRVVLAGHSTGANKVLHYAARARDRRVAGI